MAWLATEVDFFSLYGGGTRSYSAFRFKPPRPKRFYQEDGLPLNPPVSREIRRIEAAQKASYDSPHGPTHAQKINGETTLDPEWSIAQASELPTAISRTPKSVQYQTLTNREGTSGRELIGILSMQKTTTSTISSPRTQTRSWPVMLNPAVTKYSVQRRRPIG
jgi:hypothetical protein